MKLLVKSISLILLSFAMGQISFAQMAAKKISLENIFQEYKFYPGSIASLRSMNDGVYYTSLERGMAIVKWSYETGEKAGIIFTAENTEISRISDYEFSNDESKILISTAKERIYRRSFKADYYIYDISKKELKALSGNGKQQLASFSPDGKMVAFVRDNNLYYTDLASMKETQVTNDGKFNFIINGACDWVYEEEFGFSKAFAWSPDSKKLAFYRFDESGVKEFNMTYFKNLYPDIYKFKYPKAGEANSIVSIHCFNLGNQKTIKMDVGEETDQYIGRILWTKDPETLAILRLNRLQNKLDVLHAKASTGASELVFTEENARYINEPTDNSVIYLPDGQNFIIQSERDGWLHFYLYNFVKKEIKPITSGPWDISGYIGYDEAKKTLYYESHEQGVIHQDVYSIRTDGTHKKRISDEDGWSSADFSNSFKYYILIHSSANIPPKYTLCDSKGKHIRILEDNAELQKTMKEYGFAKREFLQVPGEMNTKLNAWIIKPVDFDPSKKYPLFIFVYGGPQSQDVTDNFSYSDSWYQMLVQKGYIVACVDGRGTDGRGEDFRKATYMQLGKYESEDQISAARYFGNQSYIDKSRIGIFGWSYGGYMSLLCLFKGADVFKMAISVAPVTNWRYYDSVYTERFMRTPQENPDGYDDNSPINHVDKMKGKLLLVHGMTDDNVHFQNSVELVEKLIEANKQFDMQFYPNRNHGIYGGNATFHLYTKMTNFIEENL
ncbi:MAG: S9 family peptidase [Bacteroidales bacterium]|nr:S9 family peptidase [Bacteroidales bacterium]MCB9013217.1 S9 family peptidase [Bacteroidales bacterium]